MTRYRFLTALAPALAIVTCDGDKSLVAPPVTAPNYSLPGKSVRGLAYDSGVLWAVHSEGGTSNVVKISKIDAQTGEILLESNDFNWNGRGITVGGGSLWIADAFADAVHRVDPSSFGVVSSFPTPGTEPTGIAFDGSHLWLVDPFFQRIYQLSTAGEVLTSFGIPNAFRQGLEWEADGMWTNTAETELTHYVTNGAISATRTLQGLPSGTRVGDIAIGNGTVYLSTGDRIYIQDR